MSLVSLDIETTGLDPARHEMWELALIDVYTNVVIAFQLPATLKNADPAALVVGDYYERQDPTKFFCKFGEEIQALAYLEQREAHERAAEIVKMTAGKTLLGACVHFDVSFLDPWLRMYGFVPAWSHRYLDLGSFFGGKLGMDSPASTHRMAEAVPNDNPHTALGDAAWNIEVYRSVVGLE